jgi:uncharacterized protein (TIRG00374 family)
MSTMGTQMNSGREKGPLPRPGRDALLLAGLLALLVAGLGGLVAATGWRETAAQVGRLHLWQLGVLLALSLANYGLRGLRWHLLARRLGLRTGLAQNLRHFIGGFAMSVTPGRVGELVRMRWLRRETGWAFERTAPLMLADRAYDLAALAILLGLGLSLSAQGITGAAPVAVLALIGALVVTRPGLLHGLATVTHRLFGRGARFFVRLRRAAVSLARFSSARVMLAAGLLGLIGWAAEGYAFHLLLVWLGADIAPPKAIAIFTFATLAGGLTGAPGGVGGAEAALIALLSLDGVPLETSVPATAIIRVTTLWFAIGLGLIVFPLAERASARVHQ